MRYTEEQYELLLKSLDQALSVKEQDQLDQALAESIALQTTKTELIQMRELLAQKTVSETPDDFSQGILRGIQPSKVIQLNSWMPQIAAACLILLCTALISIYTMEGTLSTEALLGVQDLSPEEAYTLLTY
ncbi:MAG: hypothetical protein Sapg2KO_51640 [Saprospiraceae bacterium]